MKSYTFIFLGFLFISFNLSAQFSAQAIIDKAIKNSGGELHDNAVIQFSFRDAHYWSKRHQGLYWLERYKNSPNGVINDIVSNSGLQRMIENCLLSVPDTLVTGIRDGVNSVHYFASLPYGLNAPAVNKELIGESEIKGEMYFKVKITFSEEGGGTDFEDQFLYWIHKDKFTVDYLAYSYAVHGGGIRFREAYNVRYVNGIRFVDYRNYKTVKGTPLSGLDTLFENEKLELISVIELKDIHVHLL